MRRNMKPIDALSPEERRDIYSKLVVSKMTYSKGVPEKSGWYWMRDDDEWEGAVKIVEVSMEEDFYVDDGVKWKISDTNEFLGPIEFPEGFEWPE